MVFPLVLGNSCPNSGMSSWGSHDVKSKDDSNQAFNRCKPKVREQGSSQRNETQISWISPELLETIESIPYHEHFIHMHDGSLPRG